MPIVALSLLVLQGLPDGVLAALSLAGGAFVAHLAFDSVRERRAAEPRATSDLRRGVLVNALSPHPWIFWITVGGPLVVDAADRSVALAAGFVAAFYAVLLGAKVALAGLVAASRRTSLARLLRPLSAVLLAAAAVALLADGLARL